VWKALLVGAMVGGMLAIILTPLGSAVFDIDLRDWRAIAIACGFGLAGIGLRFLVRWAILAVQGALARSRARRAARAARAALPPAQ
jgi:cation-transporting ATPase E